TSGADNIALHITSSSGNVYCCNTLDNTRLGTYVSGGSVATDNFKGTSFSNHEVSLLLPDVNAILGSQTHTQNCWGTDAGPAIYGEDENNPVPLLYALQYPFIVDPDIMPCFMPGEHFPVGWFGGSDDTEYEENICASDCTLEILDPESNDVKRIARGDTAVSAAVMWELQRYIYEQLQGETVGDTLILSFLAKADTGAIGAFYAVNQDISALFTADTSAIDQLQANLRLAEEKLDSIVIIDDLLPEADSIETITLWDERAALINALFDLDEDSRGVIEDIREYISDEAGKLRSQNDSITVTEVYEFNEKELNDVYLSWLSTGFGVLDSVQLNTLQSIAEQCPIEGGNAVYRARAFLAAVTQNYVLYNDSLLCTPAELLAVHPDNGPLVQPAKDETSCRVYPNPARDEVNIVWNTPSDNPGMLQIFDVFGRQIHQQALDAGTVTHTLKVGDFPEGLYIFRMRFYGWDAIRKIVITR
ncbi:MAG: T9SS type A sorting domain-containing protein, partial [Saprospiraceae bacterium]|nr:T9SS type A sorting domain-containing protein [Saprospiraceae bacterium]